MNSNVFIKRLTRDIKILKDSNLEENRIYFYLNENNITEIICMIIGPEDTPYAYGYYFFKIKITTEYPFEPPKVIFLTNSNIRFNPNLYTCGKVCISILNTWSGPQWTSCLNLKSVLLSLQTLLNKNPLENEPGFEYNFTEKHQSYINIIRHENLRVSIIERLNQVSEENFKEFKNIMIQQFLKNYSKIFKLGTEYKQKFKNYSIFKLNIYNLDIVNDFSNLLVNLKTIHHQLVKFSKTLLNNESQENSYKRKKKIYS